MNIVAWRSGTTARERLTGSRRHLFSDKARRIVGKFRAVAVVLWIGFGFTLPGCTTFGTLQQRAEQVNVISANYAASAILYNILRATYAEPLQFVSLTAVTGHGTATASLGFLPLRLKQGRLLGS